MGLIRACSGQDVVDKIIGVGEVTDGGNLLLPALTKLNGDTETEASGSTYYEHVCYCTMVVDGMLHLFGFVTNIAKATKGNIFKIGSLVNTRGISPEQWQEITSNAQLITGIDPDTFSIDESTGIISGATYAPFVVGKQYKVIDTYRHAYSDLGDVLFLVFEEASVNEEHNVSAVYDAVQELDVESPEVQQARADLAFAITSKGVPTAEDASMQTMANNVRAIPQQLNTKESDFGSFVAPSEYMWNVFEIARDLQKDNPHPEMGAFFVAEYYRGYDSLVLTGADAYLTCDGDYYAPLDKTVEVNHIWHDTDNGKSNRYVVFYYMQDGYAFSNATASICPRRVALSGRCASFIVTGENRLTDVYVLGTLENFVGGTTGGSWNPAQVIRNYAVHSDGALITSASIVSFVAPELVKNHGILFASSCPNYISLPSMDDCNILTDNSSGLVCLTSPTKSIGNNNTNSPLLGNSRVQYVDLPNVELLHGYTICVGNGNTIVKLNSVKNIKTTWSGVADTNAFVSVKSIFAPRLERISIKVYASGYYGSFVYNSPNMHELELPELTTYNVAGNTNTHNFGIVCNCGVKSFSADKLNTITHTCGGGAIVYSCVNIERISVSSLKEDKGTYGILYGDCPNLIDIIVGEYISNMNLIFWNPTTVLSTPEGIATINANIRDHIAAKVSDRTGLSALTFTVSTNLYNNLEQATIDAFTAKNWNVAGA